MGDEVIIERRFRGPPDSANGGYACGVLARFLDGPARVTLRRPPPLDTLMRVQSEDGTARLWLGQSGEEKSDVAEAVAADVTIEPPPFPNHAEAVEASSRYPWKERHPYPTCFVCGIDRPVGDGLRIFPGPLSDRPRSDRRPSDPPVVAAPWTVSADLTDEDGRARLEIVWSVLDCPSWFGFGAFHTDHGAVLLGRLEARIDGRPRAGEPCVVIGWELGREGRKIFAASALAGASGELYGVARATWIELAGR